MKRKAAAVKRASSTAECELSMATLRFAHGQLAAAEAAQSSGDNFGEFEVRANLVFSFS